jgi:hypothetical protein
MYNTMLAINNFFERTAEVDDYEIATNKIVVKGDYKVGQYIRIMGSLLNDGVYKIKAIVGDTIELTETMVDEEFYGYIVGLAVPSQFITLAAKVEAYSHAGVSSESIPNYSVSFNAKNGVEAYRSDLQAYMKPFVSPYYFLRWVRIYG